MTIGLLVVKAAAALSLDVATAVDETLALSDEDQGALKAAVTLALQ